MVEIVEIPEDIEFLTTLKYRGKNNFYLSKNAVELGRGLEKGDEMLVVIKSFTKFTEDKE